MRVTAMVLYVSSKIQIRQWFIANYSNSCCLDCTMYIEDITIVLQLGFSEFCYVTSDMPSSPLRVFNKIQ